MKQLRVDEFLAAGTHMSIIDVRSPAEFLQGHIPGAHNIPLFSNEERAVVGTLYKQQGKDAATLKGLEFIGPRMASIARNASALAVSNRILVHCWRGGMRSQSMAQLFEWSGLESATLKGGYKAFRATALSFMQQRLPLIILDGKTGSGKTEILKELKKQGAQVIDLEGLAHHKGSAFGGLGQEPQPATEHFHNMIYWELRSMDLSKPIWVEAESICVGAVHLPEPFFNQMNTALGITINVPKEIRIERLVNEYSSFSQDQLTASLEKIKKRLGNESFYTCLKHIELKEYAEVAEKTLFYYDKAYRYSESLRSKNVNLDILSDNPAETALKLAQLQYEL